MSADKVISGEIRNAFREAKEVGKDEDAVKIDMISAGASFKQVARMYTQLMQEYGYTVTKKAKDEAVQTAVAGVELGDAEGFAAAVKALQEAVRNVNERSASALIRVYAKKNGIESYRKPKSGHRKASMSAKFREFIINNPTASEGVVDAFIMENGSAKQQKNKNSRRIFHEIRVIANRIVQEMEAPN